MYFFLSNKFFFLIFLILGLDNFSLALPTQASSIKIDRIDGSNIYFQDSSAEKSDLKPLETTLFEIDPISLISVKEEPNSPFFVFLKANACEKCPFQKNIYLIRSDKKTFTKLTYPGTIKDAKTDLALHTSRAYYGKCLDGEKWAYIAYQMDRSFKRRRMQNSVFVAKILEDGSIKEELLTARRSLPSESAIKSKVKKGDCHALTAWNRTTIPFKIQTN